jgi:hypothetical protein
VIKTSVYLSAEDASALRRVSQQTGRSQAELIREAVARVVADAPRRQFRSRAMGSGPPYTRPSADEVEGRVRRPE